MEIRKETKRLWEGAVTLANKGCNCSKALPWPPAAGSYPRQRCVLRQWRDGASWGSRIRL